MLKGLVFSGLGIAAALRATMVRPDDPTERERQYEQYKVDKQHGGFWNDAPAYIAEYCEQPMMVDLRVNDMIADHATNEQFAEVLTRLANDEYPPGRALIPQIVAKLPADREADIFFHLFAAPRFNEKSTNKDYQDFFKQLTDNPTYIGSEPARELIVAGFLSVVAEDRKERMQDYANFRTYMVKDYVNYPGSMQAFLTEFQDRPTWVHWFCESKISPAGVKEHVTSNSLALKILRAMKDQFIFEQQSAMGVGNSNYAGHFERLAEQCQYELKTEEQRQRDYYEEDKQSGDFWNDATEYIVELWESEFVVQLRIQDMIADHAPSEQFAEILTRLMDDEYPPRRALIPQIVAQLPADREADIFFHLFAAPRFNEEESTNKDYQDFFNVLTDHPIYKESELARERIVAGFLSVVPEDRRERMQDYVEFRTYMVQNVTPDVDDFVVYNQFLESDQPTWVHWYCEFRSLSPADVGGSLKMRGDIALARKIITIMKAQFILEKKSAFALENGTLGDHYKMLAKECDEALKQLDQ